jgi:hypothetical protein
MKIIAAIVLEGISWKGLGIIMKWIANRIKKPILEVVKRRVSITIPERGHLLHGGAADKHIEFVAEFRNPTPVNLLIKTGKVEIIHNDIPIGSSTINNVPIPREASPKISVANYYPFLCPIGLPTKNEQWRLEGSLNMQCPYGSWDILIETRHPFSVEHEGKWEDIKAWIESKKK